MSAIVLRAITTDIKRCLEQLHADIRNSLIAPVRLANLTARLRDLTEQTHERVRRGLKPVRALDAVRQLLRDVTTFTTYLRSCNIIRLFVSRDSIAQRLRVFQIRISNTAERLMINIRTFSAADDIRTLAQDTKLFLHEISRYCTNPASLLRLVDGIHHTELRELYRLLSAAVYTRPNNLASLVEVDFAQKVRRSIEHRHSEVVSPRSISPRLVPTMPSIHDIQRDLGVLPGAARMNSPRLVPSPLAPHSSGANSAGQSAFQGNFSPSMTRGQMSPAAVAALEHSMPMPSLRSPSMSYVSDLDLGGALSPDPILFEDRQFTMSMGFQSPRLPGSPLAGAMRSPGLAASPGAGLNATSPRMRTQSSTSSASSAPRIIIRYYDNTSGQYVDWLPFQGWLWPTSRLLEQVNDHNSEIIKADSVVKVVASFVSLDDTQRQAILDHISPPSQAPALLRHSVEGEKFRVLRMFNIRNLAWLACLPIAGGGKPGFIPLKATILNGNPPADLPRSFPAPIHGSTRSFSATFRFLDSRNQWRTANCTGIVQLYRISYHEIRHAGSSTATPHQMVVKWLHFPYSNLLAIERIATAEVVITVRDKSRNRAVHLHFLAEQAAAWFVEDVKHMYGVTRRLLDLQEQRKREAAGLGASSNTSDPVHNGQPGFSSPHATGSFSPSALGSPFLPPLNNGSLSPHLSQLGSPGPSHLGSPRLSQMGSPNLPPLGSPRTRPL